jgi:hypothetical protein
MGPVVRVVGGADSPARCAVHAEAQPGSSPLRAETWQGPGRLLPPPGPRGQETLCDARTSNSAGVMRSRREDRHVHHLVVAPSRGRQFGSASIAKPQVSAASDPLTLSASGAIRLSRIDLVVNVGSAGRLLDGWRCRSTVVRAETVPVRHARTCSRASSWTPGCGASTSYSPKAGPVSACETPDGFHFGVHQRLRVRHMVEPDDVAQLMFEKPDPGRARVCAVAVQTSLSAVDEDRARDELDMPIRAMDPDRRCLRRRTGVGESWSSPPGESDQHRRPGPVDGVRAPTGPGVRSRASDDPESKAGPSRNVSDGLLNGV